MRQFLGALALCAASLSAGASEGQWNPYGAYRAPTKSPPKGVPGFVQAHASYADDQVLSEDASGDTLSSRVAGYGLRIRKSLPASFFVDVGADLLDGDDNLGSPGTVLYEFDGNGNGIDETLEAIDAIQVDRSRGSVLLGYQWAGDATGGAYLSLGATWLDLSLTATQGTYIRSEDQEEPGPPVASGERTLAFYDDSDVGFYGALGAHFRRRHVQADAQIGYASVGDFSGVKAYLDLALYFSDYWGLAVGLSYDDLIADGEVTQTAAGYELEFEGLRALEARLGLRYSFDKGRP